MEEQLVDLQRLILEPEAVTGRAFALGLEGPYRFFIDETEGHRHVVFIFSHTAFPGSRFGHRFPPPSVIPPDDSVYADVELKEGVETGRLAEAKEDAAAGLRWTPFGFEPSRPA